jgi:hypothetical protein
MEEIMARRSQAQQAEPTDTPGDAYEPAAATGELVDFPPKEEPATEVSQPTTAPATVRNGITKKLRPVEGARGHTHINLTPDPNGPRARRVQFIDPWQRDRAEEWIQFSHKPANDIIEELRTEGFRWVAAAHSDMYAGASVIEVNPNEPWRARLHADKVFQTLTNRIQTDNGMEPWYPGAAPGR